MGNSYNMFLIKSTGINKGQNRVAIRFTRIGRKHSPFFRIVAVDSRKKKNTEPLEFLGWYNPMTKETNLNAASVKKWLTVGAQPSNTVSGLLRKIIQYEARR